MKRCTKTVSGYMFEIRTVLLTIAMQFMAVLIGLVFHPFTGFFFGTLGMAMIIVSVISYYTIERDDRPKKEKKI